MRCYEVRADAWFVYRPPARRRFEAPMAKVRRGVESLRLPAPNTISAPAKDNRYGVNSVRGSIWVFLFENTYGLGNLRENLHFVHHMYSKGCYARGKRKRRFSRFSTLCSGKGDVVRINYCVHE